MPINTIDHNELKKMIKSTVQNHVEDPMQLSTVYPLNSKVSNNSTYGNYFG